MPATLKPFLYKKFHCVLRQRVKQLAFFLDDLLDQFPVGFFDDRLVMILDKVLGFDAVVLYALVCQRVQSDCFLAQGITAVFFIFQDAEHRAGAPCR